MLACTRYLLTVRKVIFALEDSVDPNCGVKLLA